MRPLHCSRMHHQNGVYGSATLFVPVTCISVVYSTQELVTETSYLSSVQIGCPQDGDTNLTDVFHTNGKINTSSDWLHSTCQKNGTRHLFIPYLLFTFCVACTPCTKIPSPSVNQNPSNVRALVETFYLVWVLNCTQVATDYCLCVAAELLF